MTPQLLETVTTRANAQIDPSLHVWGWEITVYLFLGGIVAGIFVLAAALELVSGARARSRALRLAPLAALGLLSLGMFALWLDLAHRLWAWRFYAVFRPTSPMSWGAWILCLVYPVGLAFGLGSLGNEERGVLRRWVPGVLRSAFEGLLAFAEKRRWSILVAAVAVGCGPRPLHGPSPRHDAVAARVEQRRPRAALPGLGNLDWRRVPASLPARRRSSGRRSCAGTPSRSAPSSS